MHLNDPEILRQIHDGLDQAAAVLVLDTKGVVLAANATAGRLLKLPPSALNGKALVQLKCESAEALSGLQAALKSGASWQGELDLSGVWLDARLRSLDAGAGSFLIGFDVSALKHREAELARANHDLEHFASIAAHDLHEPLRKIRAFSDRLTGKLAALMPEEARDYLARMHAAAGRMQDLIDDLLAYSSVTHNPDPFTTVNLNQTLKDVMADLEPQIESLHQDHVISVEKLPTVDGDASELHRLFQNLLANALKFRAPDRAVAISVSARDEGGFHVIHVKDNGIGFAPADAARIFQGFNRLHTKKEFPGTGIGLSICRRIVERHHGTISATGQPGQGAEFEVRLPRAPQAPPTVPTGATA